MTRNPDTIDTRIGVAIPLEDHPKTWYFTDVKVWPDFETYCGNSVLSKYAGSTRHLSAVEAIGWCPRLNAVVYAGRLKEAEDSE